MAWQVNTAAEFDAWWAVQDEGLHVEIDAAVQVLEERGPALGRPYVDTLKGARHANMKELRIRYRGKPWRIFFAFDPWRDAVLLIGGCKAGSGGQRFYDRMIPVADAIFDRYLIERKKPKGR